MDTTRSVTITKTPPPAPALGKAPARLEIPEMLGPVRLIRSLGQGGMGVVWLGRHELLGRDVAVKFLLEVPSSPEDPEFVAFLQGARAAAALSHAGLNQILNADLARGVPYLVLELIDGPSLSHLLERAGPPPLPVARTILASICGSIAELHDHDLIHRDIKPANIMLSSYGRIVVTDFGLACPRPAATFGASAGSIAGTPTYMAPEMFDGAVSARTDVYALGMTAYSVLAGRPPFSGRLDELRRAHSEQAIDAGALQQHGVPEPVIEAILRAANKDVVFRPKSARHVGDWFERAFEAAGIKPASTQDLIQWATTDPRKDAAGRPPSGALDSSTYFDQIAQIASSKRIAEAGIVVDKKAPIPPPAAPPDPRWPHERIGARLPFVAAAAAVGWVLTFSWMRAGASGLLASQMRAPNLPAWLSGSLGWASFGLVAVPALWLFHRLSFRRPPRRGITSCGRCGYNLRAISDLRCPECGNSLTRALPEQLKGSTPAARPTVQLWASVAAICTFLGLVSAGDLAQRPFSMVGLLPPRPWLDAMELAVALPLALIVYHHFARRTAYNRGVTYCGTCSLALEKLTKPECPRCGRAL